ncbi:golgin subfamily A member 6-like protein 2 [Python bivittatus]|uniref:Golgin subfamily A member 6-like protein 2 n=1 Tax=Python bivittatus TaxID=176946 RepID=A0A9F5J7G4_PYTBI|nr:golgin subfamily A member 6-like protein 2 [Python bivittatus]
MEEMASEKTKQLQEALLSQKELEIEKMRKTLLVSEAEKEALDGAVRSLKEELGQRLERLQQEASREKEKELCQLREEMQLEKKWALQEFAGSLEEAKASALQEQAVTFQKEIENLRKVIEEREAEVIQQQEAIHQQAVALKLEAKEMVQNALLQEQKKWEANTQAALQMQREALGEQDRRKWVDLQRVLEKEKKLNGALRNEAADLRRKVQGLENQAHLFEGEKRASLEELQAVLQKEKAEAVRRLREELEQERDQMRARLQQLEGDQQRLQAERSQMSLREQEAQGQADRADRCLATQVVLACRQLQDLLPKKAVLLPHMLYRGTIPLSSGTALQALQEVGAEIQSYVQDLNHELEMQRQCIFQNQREKELEMRQQEERLRLESQSVLEALKEQLVQEHLKDIIALQRSWLKEGQVEDKRVFCPQQEGRAGDLHTAQKKVAHGKDEADPTSISEPKEDLDREPESLPCRYPSSNVCKNLATPGSEGGHFSTGWSRRLPPRALCPPFLNASQSHRAAPRLPHHLQDRVRKLRAENSVYSAGTLGGFYEGWRPLALERSLSGLWARNSREQHRPRPDLTAST